MPMVQCFKVENTVTGETAFARDSDLFHSIQWLQKPKVLKDVSVFSQDDNHFANYGEWKVVGDKQYAIPTLSFCEENE